ncbi:MAG: hypothetical protein HC803_00215 [Saprospiraceae bacterium]|nr:hypothetical protein [Saprospiraceae bacterium]
MKYFERIVEKSSILLTISPNDTYYYQQHFPNIKTVYVPAFHPNETITSRIGKGEYALFHGDLSVKDNEDAAIYLITEVFNDLDIPLIIAGLNPTKNLRAFANEKIKIEANLTSEAMNERIQNAHANVLISFHSAGMKLKLLNALFKGRFCVVNHFLVDGTGMNEYCEIGNDAASLKTEIKKVFGKSFSKVEIEQRQQLLQSDLSNQKNATIIKNCIAFQQNI